MKEQEIIQKREITYEKAVNALVDLVNAITEERNYYCNHCSEICENKMTPEYRQAINDVIQLINSTEDGDLDYIVNKLENMLEKNEKYSNT